MTDTDLQQGGRAWNYRPVPGSIHAHVVDRNLLKVEVVSDQGAKLARVGDLADLQPGSRRPMGASVSNSYLQEDNSFRIELLRPGKGGIPVIVANGFLTEGNDERWGGWRPIVDPRYPDSPVYRVRWGAKELKYLGVLAAGLAGKLGGAAAAKRAAAMASKAGAEFLGRAVTPAILATDLAKNPGNVRRLST